MRKAEIINLRAYQIHLDIRHIKGKLVDYIDLGVFDTKTGARRTIPISCELKAVLERRLRGLEANDYVFTYNDRAFYNNLVTKLLKKCCNQANVPYGDNLER